MERETSVAVGDAGWICGNPNDYDREDTVDLAQLLAFLIETQPDAFDGLNVSEDGSSRRKFLARLQGEISKRGVIDVLRKGIKDGPHHVELFYGTPSPDVSGVDDLVVCNEGLSLGVMCGDDAAHFALLRGDCANRLSRFRAGRRTLSCEQTDGGRHSADSRELE